MERLEVDSGDSVCAGTGKVEIRRKSGGPVFGGFSAGKRRLLLLGGREVANESGAEGLRDAMRE